MKKLTILCFFLSSLIFSQDFNSIWNNGFKTTSSDGDFKLKFGGRIMFDYAFWNTNVNGTDESFSGSEFRRVRLFNSGQVYKNVKYKVQFDFDGDAASFKDVYMEITKVPFVGNIKVGHFKEPFRLEALTSSKYMTFMERGLPIAFSPERNVGLMLHNSYMDNKLSIQAGIFQNGLSDEEQNGNRNITSRISYLPINNNDQLLHLGIGFSSRKNSDNTYSVSTRPENHMGNKLISASIENVEQTNLIGTEMAWVMGPLSVQGEYIMNTVDADETYNFTSYYGQISYFLTGEKRKYKNSLAGFDRVSPGKNLGNDGMGALELAARYSSMDLSEANGGILNDITLGLNWYLNPSTRIMFNYVMGVADVNSEDINENTLQMRMQIDF
tara:strand:+ start:234 stop:1385 length:1152 start_codon:yes stop_codon:yes gene_type:complete